MLNLSSLICPLPLDIASAKMGGDYDLALRLIARVCADPNSSALMKERLELEAHILSRMRIEAPFTFAEAEAGLRAKYPQLYQEGMLMRFIEEGRFGWEYIDREIHLERAFFDNVAKVCPELEKAKENDPEMNFRDQNVRYMKEHGSRKAHIEAKVDIKVTNPSFYGKKAWVNLPFIAPAQGVSNIQLLDRSDNYLGVDGEGEAMRSAQASAVLSEREHFFIRFSYDIEAVYHDFSAREASLSHSDVGYLDEKLPHIMFHPYLRKLAKDIVGEETDPLTVAHLIYNWITTHIAYSFMREYVTYENIPLYAATNGKGDCGVQAMLFITLCRISGVPSRWQSGWYVTPEGVFRHDWAQFYASPYGWLYADCSFGGGAYRQGAKERWQYYFGNLDVYRMPANHDLCCTLTGKKAFAADPTDNQSGEVEVEGVGLMKEDVQTTLSLISFTYLDA